MERIPVKLKDGERLDNLEEILRQCESGEIISDEESVISLLHSLNIKAEKTNRYLSIFLTITIVSIILSVIGVLVAYSSIFEVLSRLK